MRKYLLTAAAAAAFIATPAFADGPYVGIEGGVLFPNKSSVDVFAVDEGSDVSVNDVVRINYDTGFDVDVIGGYDLGMFRLEGELGYKEAGLKDVTATTGTDSAELDGKATVYSAMINGLVDFGGAGFGAGSGG